MTPAQIFASDLRAHAYIAARGLSPDVVARASHDCPSCRLAEMLPAVLRILASTGKADRAPNS
jgi:hypothetical protein